MLIITVSTTNLNYTITQLSVMQLLIPIMIIKDENENSIKESNSKLFIEKTLFIVGIFDVNYAYRTNILLYTYRLVIVYEKQIIIHSFKIGNLFNALKSNIQSYF